MSNGSGHFKDMDSMASFSIVEALHQWARLKRELHGVAFFGLSYKDFWEHVSRHFDHVHGYPEVLTLTRITSLMLPDSSCCEVGYSAYNRTHTAERANLQTSTVRNVLSVRTYGPKSVSDFNPQKIYEIWMGLIAPDVAGGTISCSRRRSVAAMIRKTLASAQSTFGAGGWTAATPAIFA